MFVYRTVLCAHAHAVLASLLSGRRSSQVTALATPLKSFIRAPGMSTLWNLPPGLSPRRSHRLLKHFPSLASKRFIILLDCFTLAVPSTKAGIQKQHRGACEQTCDQGLGLSLRSGSLLLATVSLAAQGGLCGSQPVVSQG